MVPVGPYSSHNELSFFIKIQNSHTPKKKKMQKGKITSFKKFIKDCERKGNSYNHVTRLHLAYGATLRWGSAQNVWCDKTACRNKKFPCMGPTGNVFGLGPYIFFVRSANRSGNTPPHLNF